MNSEFFDPTKFYGKVINENYLDHREVIVALNQFLIHRFSALFSIDLVDLGCNDGRLVPKMFSGLKLNRYVGVDISSNALALAQKNMAKLSCQKNYICDDFVVAFKKLKFTPHIVWIGLSYHHLSREEKLKFMNCVYKRLSKNGIFVFYEPVLREGQSRVEHREESLSVIKDSWSALNPQEIYQACQHIVDKDYPESLKTYREWSEQIGFSSIVSIFTDRTGLLQLIALCKQKT